jgi:hypothetical protein
MGTGRRDGSTCNMGPFSPRLGQRNLVPSHADQVSMLEAEQGLCAPVSLPVKSEQDDNDNALPLKDCRVGTTHY